MISIIDYGVGNVGSIKNMLGHIGVEAEIVSTTDQILKARRLILPGVGAYDSAMTELKNRNLVEVIRQKALEDRTPFLGICLGMQILLDSSEEGSQPGLGFISGKVVKFNKEKCGRVPHMGWNTLIPQTTSDLLDGLVDARFYFVHSYYVTCNNVSDVLANTNYGGEFASCIARNNVFGVQFHPDKSHKFGMKILANFARL